MEWLSAAWSQHGLWFKLFVLKSYHNILLMMQHAIVATTRPQITYGPPPASKGYGKVAEYPIQALVRVKAMARVESVENCRGSSPV